MTEQAKKQAEMQMDNAKQRLRNSEERGLKRVKKTIDDHMSKEMRMKDPAYPNRIDNLAKDKFHEARSILIERYEAERTNIDYAHFEKRFEVFMSAFVQRVDLMLRFSARDKEGSVEAFDTKVSTEMEYLRLIEFAFPYLQQIDAGYVLSNAFDSFDPAQKDMTQEQIDKMFESLYPEDHFKLLKKIYSADELKPEDYKILRRELDYAVSNGGKYARLAEQNHGANPRMTTAAMLLQSLSPVQRVNMLREKMEEPYMPNEMRNMVEFGYITIGQARMLIRMELDRLAEANSEPKQVKKQIEAYDALMKYLNLNKKAIYEKRKSLLKHKEEKAKELVNHMTGHYNKVGKVATPKGILGYYLLFNGAITAGSNLVVSMATSSGQAFTNPALWAGVAMVGAGLQLTDGSAGMFDTPGEMLGKLTKDRKELKVDELDKRKAELMEQFGHNPDLAQFYYKYAQNIDSAFERLDKKSEGSINLEEVITLTKEQKAAGKTVESEIEAVCKSTGLTRLKLEARLRAWARTISDPVNGAGRNGYKAQREFLRTVDKETSTLEGKNHETLIDGVEPPLYSTTLDEEKTETKTE